MMLPQIEAANQHYIEVLYQEPVLQKSQRLRLYHPGREISKRWYGWVVVNPIEQWAGAWSYRSVLTLVKDVLIAFNNIVSLSCYCKSAHII